jgi:hypothetical protein
LHYSIEEDDIPKATRRSWAMPLVGATAYILIASCRQARRPLHSILPETAGEEYRARGGAGAETRGHGGIISAWESHLQVCSFILCAFETVHCPCDLHGNISALGLTDKKSASIKVTFLYLRPNH